MNYSLILLCAGSGKRTGLKYNKIFYKINNQTVYEMNISHFLEDNRCKQIIVVTKENEIEDIRHLVNDSRIEYVFGGKERQDSVYEGLQKVTEDYVFVSAYCHAKKHNSVIYMINKESHRFIKEIILPGQPHVGGLAYDSEHQILWYSSNTQELAQAVSLTMESIENYDYDAGRHPIATNQIASLYGIVRDSFMTFYDGCLYVGCFTKYTDSAIARYAVDDQGNLINTMDEGLGMNFGMAVPLDYSTISEQAQGMAFYNDKLLLSHSFGILPSRVVFYEKSDKRLYVDENSAVSYRFPERIEQIFVDGDDLYVLFESAAYAYSSASVNIVDRVLKLSLPRMEEYQQSIQSNVSQY